MQNQSNVKMNVLPDMAFIEGSILSKVSHAIQGTKNYQTGQLISITRYQRDYTIEYSFVENELEIWSVDGNTDVEDTYSPEFIRYMENKIEDLHTSKKENDDEHDDWFQNGD